MLYITAMNFREFLKPTFSKLILFIILFGFFTLLPTGFTKNILLSLRVFPQINYLGFPLNFFEKQCFATNVIGGSVHCSNQIDYIKLGFDIVFWYIVSAGIISLLTKKSK